MLPREQHPSKPSRAWRNLPQQKVFCHEIRWWQQMVRKRKHPKCCGACNKDKTMQKVLYQNVKMFLILWMDSKQVHFNIVYRIAQVHLVYIIYTATITVTGFHKSTVPSLINTFGWCFPSFFRPQIVRGFGHTSTIFGTTRNRSTEIRTFQINQIQTSIDWVSWKWANWKHDLLNMTQMQLTSVSWRFQAMNQGK